MTTTELLALLSVDRHQFMTEKQRAACFDVLIPSGFIDATGFWRITSKGREALREGARTNEVIGDLMRV